MSRARPAFRLAFSGVLLASLLFNVVPVQGQTTPAPAFTAAATKVYAHTSVDDLSVWMNTLLDDGAPSPYYVFGPSAFTDPVLGLGVDPVANQAFEVHIPLTPALTQSLVLDGTVNVQAYIGGGAYSGGVANIGTSLQADGKSLGSAAAKQHIMSPKNSNAPQLGTTYDPISWSFAVSKAVVPAGATLEWILSGTALVGNNIFLSTYEARGRSYIELPVASAGGAAALTGATAFHVLPTGPASINRTEATLVTGVHVYNWTDTLVDPQLRLAVQVANGTAAIQIVGNGTVLLTRTFSATGNLTDALDAARLGPWTIRLNLTGFRGSIALRILETPSTAVPATTSSNPSTASSAGATTRTSGAASSSGSAASTTAKSTPSALAPAVGLVLIGLVALRRRLKAA